MLWAKAPPRRDFRSRAGLAGSRIRAGQPESAEARFARVQDFARSGEPSDAIDQALALEEALAHIDAEWARHLALRVRLVRAEALEETGSVEAAIALGRALLAAPLLPQLPDAAVVTDVLRHNLAYALLHSNGFTEAEALIRQVLDSETARLGPDHPQTLYTRKYWASPAPPASGRGLAVVRRVYARRRSATATITRSRSARVQLAAPTAPPAPAETEPLLRRA